MREESNLIKCNEARLDRIFWVLCVIALVIISTGFGFIVFLHNHFEQCEEEYTVQEFTFDKTITDFEDLTST